jgi:hypothetical protein
MNRKSMYSLVFFLTMGGLVSSCYAVCPVPTGPPVYYVKNGGNDLMSGLCDEEAWQSISRVNLQMQGCSPNLFPPGTTVLFKRGSTFTEELQISCSGGPR